MSPHLLATPGAGYRNRLLFFKLVITVLLCPAAVYQVKEVVALRSRRAAEATVGLPAASRKLQQLPEALPAAGANGGTAASTGAPSRPPMQPRCNFLECIFNGAASVFEDVKDWITGGGGCIHGQNCGGPDCHSDTWDEGDYLDKACYEHKQCLRQDNQTQYVSNACDSGEVNCRCDYELRQKAYQIYRDEHKECATLDLFCWEPDLAAAAKKVMDAANSSMHCGQCQDNGLPPGYVEVESPPPAEHEACANYTQFDDVDLFGGELAEDSFHCAEEPEDCCSLCDHRADECASWTWLPRHPRCQSQPACILKAQSGFCERNLTGAISGLRFVGSPAPRCEDSPNKQMHSLLDACSTAIHTDTALESSSADSTTGTNSTSVHQAAGASECCQNCSDADGCMAWVFNSTSSGCALRYDANYTLLAAPGITSGTW